MAATWCEMFVISAEDLSALFLRCPREGKMIHRAVLAEHKRKEQMRALSMRFLIRALEKESSVQPPTAISEKKRQIAAVLKLQHAWNRFGDNLAFKVRPAPLAGRAHGRPASHPPRPVLTLASHGRRRPSTSPTSRS